MNCFVRRLLLACLVAVSSADSATAQIPRGHFVNVQPVPGLEGGRIDHNPWVSEDGLRIYFSVGWNDASDIWYAERESIDEPFSDPIELPDSINHRAEEECCFFVFNDERSALFESERPELTHNTDTLIVNRDSIDSPWGEPTPFPSDFDGELEATYNLELSPDELSLYFTALHEREGTGLYVANRESTGDPFAAPTPLAVNTKSFEEKVQTVSTDGRLVLYQSNQDADYIYELWGAVRRTPDEPFGEPMKIDDLFPGTQIDVEGRGQTSPYLARDWPANGSKLYFSFGTLEDSDIYEATWVSLGGLQAGDADQDLDFDQLDLVRVQVANKYLTGEEATWGEGDWDGAPGGSPGDPPLGDGQFNQLDILAALSAGTYLTGAYRAIGPAGQPSDSRTSVGYNANTGEVWVDVPADKELTSINIDSDAGVFTGGPAQNLAGSFDNDADHNIFRATFGRSFGSMSFGNVAQRGLGEPFLLDDLTVVGSLAGGGPLGDVDLIYIPVPEPSTVLLLLAGFAALLANGMKQRLLRAYA